MPSPLSALVTRRPATQEPRRLGEQRARLDAKAVAPQDSAPVFGAGVARRRLSAPNSTNRHLDAYAGGDDAIDWVMDAVSLIADTAAAAPTHFERDGKLVVANLTDDYPEGTEAAPGDLARLMSQPNGTMDWSELIFLTLVDFLLVGNGWWYKHGTDASGKPLAIFRLHPAHVTIMQNTGGGISGYEYNPPGGGKKLSIKPEDMLHFRRPNPHNDHYGAGVIAGAPRMFDLELYLTESQTDYYERGTRLSGVLETDGNVSPALFEKLKRTFKSFYSGRDNAYEVAVLERGLKYNTIQNSASDAEYVSMSRASRDRILAAFRVPLAVLGGLGGVEDSRAVAEAQRVFDNKTMRPLLDKFQKAISIGLTQAWGLDFKIDYEYLPPKEDQLAIAGTIATLPGVMVHEIRAAAGYDPLPHLDDGSEDPRNYIVLNLPGENDNDSKVKDRPLAGEAGRARTQPRSKKKCPTTAEPASARAPDTLIPCLDASQNAANPSRSHAAT
jgi:HK97 family phage portal protein